MARGDRRACERWRDIASNSCYKICDLRRWNCPTLRNFPYWTFMQQDISLIYYMDKQAMTRPYSHSN